MRRRCRRVVSLVAVALVVVVGRPLLLTAEAERTAGIVWRVGRDDFVNYTIDVVRRTDSKCDGYARWNEIEDVAGFHGYELRDGRRIERRITHESVLHMAFVFRLPNEARTGARETIREELPGTWRLAPILATGTFEVLSVLGDAPHRIVAVEGKVAFTPATREPDVLGRSCRAISEGALTWSALYDEARGALTDIEYHLSYASATSSALRPDGVSSVDPAPRRYDASVHLTLDRVLEHRYAGFGGDVGRAVDRGVEHLRRVVDRSLVCHRDPADPDWDTRRLGELALMELALLHGGLDETDPVVAEALTELLKHEPKTTYHAALALMALDAYRTPAVEAEMRIRGELKGFLPRRLTDRESAFRDATVAFLLATARTGARRPGEAVTGADGVLRWGYPREAWPEQEIDPAGYWDNSNSQYAVLGLDAAERCGARIPVRVWRAIANHWLSTQGSPGEARRDMTIVAKDAASGFRPSPYAPESVKVSARGWCYSRSLHDATPLPPFFVPYGAMTCGGVGSLAIARSHLVDRAGSGFGAKQERELDQALLDGLAALDDMFTVWSHPEYEGWYTYYLYALERAGMLAGVERFGDHDWYWEGAVQLLLRQRPEGERWVYDNGSDDSAAWALLFLRQATQSAVITPSSKDARGRGK